jgi:hypothetical protein
MRPLTWMSTSNSHPVRNPLGCGAADPQRILLAGGVLMDREAVALIQSQGFPLPAADITDTIIRRL